LFNTDFMLSALVDEQIEKIALGEPWKPIFRLNKSSVNSFKIFAGTYEISADDVFRITVENDKIYYQGNDKKKYAAFPYNETSIYIKETNSRYRFTLDKKSEGISFVGFIGTPVSTFMVEGKRIKNK
jgi:hypothetical protein